MSPSLGGKGAYTLFLIIVLITQVLLSIVPVNDGIDWTPPTRAPFGQHPLSEGSLIYVHEGGKFVNDSFYIPIPVGSMVLDANLAVSPRPSQENSSNYPVDPWFKVRALSNDHEYPPYHEVTNDYLGSWGKQTANRTGVGYYSIDTLKSNRPFEMIVPKGATITDMELEISGNQRKDAFIVEDILGSSDGDRTGQCMINAGRIGIGDGDVLIVTAPDDNTKFGTLFRMYYSGGFTSEKMAQGPVQFADYGASLSEKFKVTSSTEYIMVGAPMGGPSQQGSVYLYNVKNTYTTTNEDALTGYSTDDLFGKSVCVGDLDSDTWSEMIVGAPGADSGSGEVYVLEYDTAVHNFSTRTSLKATIQSPSSETSFGRAVSSGDFNSDGIDDLAIASDQKVHIYYGSNAFDTVLDLTIDPITDGSLDSFSFMDFIGDPLATGADTIAVGSPVIGDRCVLMYDGSMTPDVVPDETITSTSTNNFGQYVSNVFDYDDDGTLEFAIGAPSDSTSSQIHLRSRSLYETTLTDARTGAMFGSSILLGADLRGDSYPDICTGAIFKYDITPKGIGRIVVHEYYDIETLPVNRPTINLGSSPIWTYEYDHLSGNVKTGDMSDTVNPLISSLVPDDSLKTEFNEYLVLPLSVEIPTNDGVEGSTIFNITSFKILYDQRIVIKDLTSKLNQEIEDMDADTDGFYHVPVKFSSQGEGGLLIETFDLTIDLPPVFTGYPKVLKMDEDGCADLLDLRTYVSDDLTDPSDIVFEVLQDPRNASFVNITLHNGRYLRADAFNDTSPSATNDNWTGIAYPMIRIFDDNGLIAIVNDITIEVMPVNDPPALKEGPDLAIDEDKRWMFTPGFVDAENDKITYNAVMPPGMTFEYNRTYIWNTNNSVVGENIFTIHLTDGLDARDYRFTISVKNLNDPPFFLDTPPEYSEIYTDEVFNYLVQAIDIDVGDYLSYALLEGEGATIDAVTGNFTFSPSRFYPEPVTFKVQVTDQSFETSVCTFKVGTIIRLYPPTVTSTPELLLHDMVNWSYSLSVEDPNGDIPSIVFISGPKGMKFDIFLNRLIWRPDIDQVGKYNVSMLINSSGFSIYYNITLDVQRSVRVWELSFKTPSDGSKATGKLRIVGNVQVQPGKVRSVQLRVEGSEWRNISFLDDAFSVDLDTTKLSDGKRKVEIRAFDGYEYSYIEDMTIIVANHEGEISIWTYLLIAIVIILILALIGFLGYIGYKALKRRDEEEEKERKVLELQKSKAEMDTFLAQNVSSQRIEDIPIKPDQVDAMDLDDLIKRTGAVRTEQNIPTMKAGSDKVYNLSDKATPHDADIPDEEEVPEFETEENDQ